MRGRIVKATALAASCLVAALLVGCSVISNITDGPSEPDNPGYLRDATPQVLVPEPTGVEVIDDKKATLDYSNTSQGYISVRSKMSDTRVKVLVNVVGKQYQYTIDPGDSYVTIPLSEGSGVYSVGVWENTTGDRYASILAQDLDVQLANEDLPFLYPSQYVNFSAGDQAVNLSAQLAEGATSEREAINQVYQYVCDTIDYDYDKISTLASGYLPNNADTLSSKMGICFDYAVLTTSMLRAQGIPCKLIIGYAGSIYHAWIMVYSEGGKVHGYELPANQYGLLDPTFDAAGAKSQDLSQLIGEGADYQPMFQY
jgi:transglutaminase-like putative cysteine protease